MALEIILNIKAELVILQELFIGNQKLVYSAFNFYWPQGKRIAMRVMTTVKKDLLDKITIEHRINLINHPYFILFKIQNLDQQSKQLEKKTRILNVYNNYVRQSCTQNITIFQVRQVLENIKQESIIKKKFLIAQNINAYSTI